MSEDTTAEDITVTDAQVEEFFNGEGEIKETPKEEVVEPAKAEPAKEEVKDEPAKEEKKVNYGALHEERMRRKEMAERAKKAEDERDELRRQLQQRAPREEENLEDDPVEALKRDNAQIKQILTAQAKHALNQTENQKYWGKVAESEKAFKQDKPDFDDAVKFLAETRKEELKDLGWSDQEAAKVLSDEIRWISDKAYADEVNPAERFYNLALRRGFKAKEPEDKPEKNTQADEKLSVIKKGQQTNRSLPPASKSVKQDLTAESLADMNVDALSNIHGSTDFDKAWTKLFGAA